MKNRPNLPEKEVRPNLVNLERERELELNQSFFSVIEIETVFYPVWPDGVFSKYNLKQRNCAQQHNNPS